MIRDPLAGARFEILLFIDRGWNMDRAWLSTRREALKQTTDAQFLDFSAVVVVASRVLEPIYFFQIPCFVCLVGVCAGIRIRSSTWYQRQLCTSVHR
jgi:hypothetical protein